MNRRNFVKISVNLLHPISAQMKKTDFGVFFQKKLNKENLFLMKWNFFVILARDSSQRIKQTAES